MIYRQRSSNYNKSDLILWFSLVGQMPRIGSDNQWKTYKRNVFQSHIIRHVNVWTSKKYRVSRENQRGKHFDTNDNRPQLKSHNQSIYFTFFPYLSFFFSFFLLLIDEKIAETCSYPTFDYVYRSLTIINVDLKIYAFERVEQRENWTKYQNRYSHGLPIKKFIAKVCNSRQQTIIVIIIRQTGVYAPRIRPLNLSGFIYTCSKECVCTTVERHKNDYNIEFFISRSS